VNITVFHGSPRVPLSEYVHPEEAEKRTSQLIAESECQIIVPGHTHKPYTIEHGATLLLNPGSVGQPRDGDSRASYATVVLEEGRFKPYFHRVAYAIEAPQERMRRLSLPMSLSKRLQLGR
jgi:putative phosphoesterase